MRHNINMENEVRTVYSQRFASQAEAQDYIDNQCNCGYISWAGPGIYIADWIKCDECHLIKQEAFIASKKREIQILQAEIDAAEKLT
jgi:hypothetical protein